MTKEILDKVKLEFGKIIEYFKQEIAQIRTSRVSPSLVENIKVNVYGSTSSVREVATITVPEPRVLVIQPWDKNILKDLEAALRKNEIELNPVVDGNVIKINVPPLSEERRMEFIKLLHQKMESFRIRIRQIREDIWRKTQRMEKEKKIREDEKFKLKDKLQDLVDEYNEKIEELGKKKEEELMM